MSKPQPLPGSFASSRWLISRTLDLLPPLALASLLACLNRLASPWVFTCSPQWDWYKSLALNFPGSCQKSLGGC